LFSVEEVKEKPVEPEVKEEQVAPQEPEESSDEVAEESESESESESDEQDYTHMTDAERKRAKAVYRIQVNLICCARNGTYRCSARRNEDRMQRKTKVLTNCALPLFASWVTSTRAKPRF
jgi:hypothetical protein